MKLKYSLLLLTSFFIITISCSTTEPPDPPIPPPVVEEPILTLELDDAHCTEAWISLTTKDLELPAELTLKQFNPSGDSVTQTFSLSTADTLFYIDSLLPNQSYKILATMQQSNNASNELSVTTMDTTSHNFIFEMITFGGEISSSVLYDVAIISENNIWAVGEIWIADTSSLGYTKYNAVHWDGTNWELKRIYYYGSCSAVEYPPLMAIWAFNESDLVITNGGSIGWFNGTNVILDCRINALLSGEIKKIWGSSSNDLYIVGTEGNIAHYNGTNWTKIESNTTLNINDIWGDYNEKTQEWEILAVGGNILAGYDNIILQVQSNSTALLNAEGTGWPLSGIWFKSNRKYYLVGSGIYKKAHLNESLWDSSLISISEFHTNAVRANNINDVFIVGAYGEVLHFNGINWNSYQNELGVFFGSYKSIAIKDDIIVSVGFESTQAKILIGRR